MSGGLIKGEPPRDGETYHVTIAIPVRWKAYSPKSQQFRMGIAGRWQQMNEFGGWDNIPGGRHWPFVGYLAEVQP